MRAGQFYGNIFGGTKFARLAFQIKSAGRTSLPTNQYFPPIGRGGQRYLGKTMNAATQGHHRTIVVALIAHHHRSPVLQIRFSS
jgi:hypothetical protein